MFFGSPRFDGSLKNSFSMKCWEAFLMDNDKKWCYRIESFSR